MKVLYLTYDGLADHIGQSQVLPYLLGCAASGHEITVISFEKPDRMQRFGDAVARRCTDAGIDWRPQPFHSSPPLLSKLIDLRAMRRAAKRAVSEGEFDLAHCRSYPAASVGLHLKRKYGLRLLFDMRGFWPDQRHEGGRWRAESLLGRRLYNHWKKLERRLYSVSDHIVVLTQAARDVVAASPTYRSAPLSVIPCCADFELFDCGSPSERVAARSELGIAEDASVLVYLGSLGTVYRLNSILELFTAAREHVARLKLLFIGSGPREAIFEEARRIGIELSSDDIRSVSAAREEVPKWLNAGDIGLCFCTPTFSSLGVSATKVGEYLACGLPVIGNGQIGDLAEIVAAVGSGYVVDDLGSPSLRVAGERVPRLLQTDGHEIRERASRFLDLRRGVAAYRSIYDDLGRPVIVGP